MTPVDFETRCRWYLAALNRHDVPSALTHLSADFLARFPGGVSLTRADLALALGWDTSTNGYFAYDSLDIGTAEISGVLTETNDFYKLLGLEPATSRTTFRFDADGLICEQLYEPLPPLRSVAEALEAPMAWARRERAAEFEMLAPDGSVVYTEDAGRRWVALLREWRTIGDEPVST